jgi:RNA polymerase sigma-70 factor (ECF subfamily)
MGSSDEALLAGLAAGDGDVTAAFVRRFQRRVYGLALTIVDNPAVAEEVAQETFVRAWTHAATYDARRGSVLTWMLAIARHVAIDVIRPGRVETADPDVVIARLELSEQAGDPEIGDRERLREALETIGAEQRRAVLQAAVLGRTAREIGESEGIPLGTAKTRIRTGLLRLRAALEVADEC